MNGNGFYVFSLLLALAIQVNHDRSCLESDKERQAGLNVIFSKYGTFVPSAMKIIVGPNLTLEDERGRPVTRKRLVQFLGNRGESKRNTFRFVFVDAKRTSLEDVRKFIELLEVNVPLDIQTIVHIQIRPQKK